MIKFDLFENDTGYQCHFRNIGSFVVSIAHYMRAHFNYQAIQFGRNFQLPGDAGYLNVSVCQVPFVFHISQISKFPFFLWTVHIIVHSV